MDNDTNAIQDTHQPQTQAITPANRNERISCPIWHSPMLFITPEGILVKCKSCRGEMHLIRREELEKIWDKFIQGAAPATNNQSGIIA